MTQATALEILKSGANVFLTGEPGAGKTYTINQFVEWCEENDRSVAITASTGIAASHIDGRTIHSWSGINTRRQLSRDKVENLKFDDRIMANINSADVLIVDEISMLDSVFIDDLDNICRILRGDTDHSFGSLQVVFVGDFFQLPPVPDKRGGPPTEFAFKSIAWESANFRVCYLTEQHRQSEPVYLDLLNAMRSGTINQEHIALLKSRTGVPEPEMHLYPLRLEVDAINNGKLWEIPGPVKTYRMYEEGIPYLCSVLKKQVLSPEVLELKIGAEVMFTRNDRDGRFVNGTLGKVVGYDHESGFPIVEKRDGTRIVPERVEWPFEENGQIKASVRQLPLRLAWAITVHKSQGMSLDSASIDLSNCFEYGQGYVAISRVRSLEGLHLQGLNGKVFCMHPDVISKDKEFREQGV